MATVQLFGEQVAQVWTALAARGITGTEVESGDSTPAYEVTDDELDTIREVAAQYGVADEDLVVR